ncbi:unnamed protein product [Lampetra planeri]
MDAWRKIHARAPGEEENDTAADMPAPVGDEEASLAEPLPARPPGGTSPPGRALHAAHSHLTEILHDVASILDEIHHG